MDKILDIEKIILPENKKAHSYFDKETDVLYISFGKPSKSEVYDNGSDTLIRFNSETSEITGITILNFSNNLKKSNPTVLKESSKRKAI